MRERWRSNVGQSLKSTFFLLYFEFWTFWKRKFKFFLNTTADDFVFFLHKSINFMSDFKGFFVICLISHNKMFGNEEISFLLVLIMHKGCVLHKTMQIRMLVSSNYFHLFFFFSLDILLIYEKMIFSLMEFIKSF